MTHHTKPFQPAGLPLSVALDPYASDMPLCRDLGTTPTSGVPY